MFPNEDKAYAIKPAVDEARSAIEQANKMLDDMKHYGHRHLYPNCECLYKMIDDTQFSVEMLKQELKDAEFALEAMSRYYEK